MNLKNVTNRVTPIWNSLPNSVVTADSVNSFKYRLDKFWSLQCMILYMITEPLSPLLPEVQEIKFSYDRSYLT